MISFNKALTLLSISLCFITFSSVATSENQSTVSSSTQEFYGVDVSFPMHYHSIRNGINPLGNRQEFYDDFMNGCREHAKEYSSGCDETEADRISSNLLQPAFMVNFTENGYKKIRAPEGLFQIIKEFWEKNRHNQTIEAWSVGETVTNHWVNPSNMLNIGDTIFEGGGTELYEAIADAARLSIQEWTGMELSSTSVYGIRIYNEGSVLAPHVDRLPLISSAIINVDQDVDEPWPLEVIGHNGVAENVTMLPGDLVLYESHSVIHGRPYPLKGRFFANIFIHFKPIASRENVSLPYYIIPNSTEAEEWYNDKGILMENQHSTLIDDSDSTEEEEDTEESIDENGSNDQYGRNLAHIAAMEEDFTALQELIELEGEDVLTSTDNNGWTALHEAARTLNLEIVKFLVEHGADVNVRNVEDETALDIAKHFGGIDHPVTLFLESVVGSHDEL